MRGRLDTENYLETEGYTIDSIVDEMMVPFENQIKRTTDVNKKGLGISIKIRGLKEDKEKKFMENRILLRPSVEIAKESSV